jgi:hypothetical protein
MDAGEDGKPAGSVNENKEFSFALYNTNGSLVAKGVSPKNSNAAKVDIRNLPKGIYFLRVNRGAEQVEKQIIVNNQ